MTALTRSDCTKWDWRVAYNKYFSRHALCPTPLLNSASLHLRCIRDTSRHSLLKVWPPLLGNKSIMYESKCPRVRQWMRVRWVMPLQLTANPDLQIIAGKSKILHLSFCDLRFLNIQSYYLFYKQMKFTQIHVLIHRLWITLPTNGRYATVTTWEP